MSRRPTLGLSLLGLAVAALGAFKASPTLASLQAVAVARWTGYPALLFLILSQAMAPAARFRLISPTLQAAGRRDFGIASAGLATLHALCAWRLFFAMDLWPALESVSWVQLGTASWILLVALWLTSYPRLTRALRLRLWKPLHQLAYLALGLALLHAFMAPWNDCRVTVLLGIIVGISWGTRCFGALPVLQYKDVVKE